jgi:hypothetical protein
MFCVKSLKIHNECYNIKYKPLTINGFCFLSVTHAYTGHRLECSKPVIGKKVFAGIDADAKTDII